MPHLSYLDIVNNLKNCVGGVYFLYGEEDYFIEEILKTIKASFKENVNFFFGDDCDINKVLQNMYQQSIFSDIFVSVVRDAQECRFLVDKKNESYIKNYVDKYSSSSILVFIFSSNIVKTSSLFNIFENAFIYNSKKLTSYQVKTFIRDYCKQIGRSINSDFVDKLYDCCGSNILLIKEEINKGCNHDNIAYLKEFNIFEFISYVSSKNVDKLILMINNFGKKNKDDVIPILGFMFSFFSKLLSFYDAKDKSAFTSQYINSVSVYSRSNVLDILSRIEYCDMLIKGIGSTIFDYKNVMKYLVGSLVMTKK